MPPWIEPLIWLFAAGSGLWSLAKEFWDRITFSEEQILLKLAPPPAWTIARVIFSAFSVICLVFVCWGMFQSQPPLQAVSISIFLACMNMSYWINQNQVASLQGLGILAPARFFWSSQMVFVPWSDIHDYTWKGSDLILNPGWRQTTCVIPEECVAAVEAILIERCPRVGLESPATH